MSIFRKVNGFGKIVECLSITPIGILCVLRMMSLSVLYLENLGGVLLVVGFQKLALCVKYLFQILVRVSTYVCRYIRSAHF